MIFLWTHFQSVNDYSNIASLDLTYNTYSCWKRNQTSSHSNTYAYDYDHAIHAIHFFSQTPNAFKYEESPANIVTWMTPQTNSNNSSIATRQRDWTHNSKSPSWIYTMSDNKKQEKDFTKEVDALLPEAATTIKACL